MEDIVVLTDLDGTLLDPSTYTFEAATEALKALREREIPLVLVSSKTRAEIEPIRFSLDNHHPFIVENGGGLHIPKGLFDFPVEGSQLRGPYQVIEGGTSYVILRTALKEIEQSVGHILRGFGDMSAEEVAERTGLNRQEALLAKQREHDEPFVIEGDEAVVETVKREVEARGLRFVQGGRFFHLTGDIDKGRATGQLLECYRRQAEKTGHRLITVAAGDSPNDLAMLTLVDRPIVVQKPDSSYDPSLLLPHVIKASGVGPAGWNQAILNLLTSV